MPRCHRVAFEQRTCRRNERDHAKNAIVESRIHVDVAGRLLALQLLIEELHILVGTTRQVSYGVNPVDARGGEVRVHALATIEIAANMLYRLAAFITDNAKHLHEKRRVAPIEGYHRWSLPALR